MTALTTADDAVARLREVLRERLFTAGDEGYDAARLPWNLVTDQRPYAVAVPRTADEVATVVQAAAASGLRIAPQATGHGAGPLRGTDLGDTIVVSLREMRDVAVDPGARTATLQGGAVWHDVLAAATPHGLTAAHGSAGDVSVVGYALGGGVSFYGRTHGLAVNGVRRARVVVADGSIVTASADENPELFWALRGGAGAFGVVVELTIDLLPYSDVFAGLMLWDGSRAADVARAWVTWTATAPETTTTSLRIMHFPPLPELPPFVSGRSVVAIDGAVLEGDAAAAEILAPLRALEPEMDTFGRIPAAALTAVHMDPPEPSAAVSEHAMLTALDDAFVDAFVTAAFAARPMISEIRHCGGAFARPAADAGAVSALEGDYLLSALTIVPVPPAVPGGLAACGAVVDAVRPWRGPGVALTFVDLPDRDVTAGFGAGAARLAALRRERDPEGIFVAAHPVG
ncbi:FAD-binding oxidoreductase [Microbacterium horticulturae]|uniref:FAD-binding oxidoreductase n=1 Tax=Microbacterium horticulturae TaxID=3028316 RepID=A0ABY8BXA5_9MICO|nr:FAD-binding oxidoreductase [Microbacterium sp. KACC 23027]WEG08829.1 FAD-binding oxidoreductase [Microbacterium sp. KACC 23027]